MGRLRTVHRVQGNRVVVDAGATWSEVLAATLPHGLTPPVFTDYLGLSVGATLVVGGVGGAISRFGLLSSGPRLPEPPHYSTPACLGEQPGKRRRALRPPLS